MNSGWPSMKENAVKTVVALATGNEVTNDGVVTALSLEQSVFLGMTFGAWFKVGLLIALLLLILERGFSVYKACSEVTRRRKKHGQK